MIQYVQYRYRKLYSTVPVPKTLYRYRYRSAYISRTYRYYRSMVPPSSKVRREVLELYIYRWKSQRYICPTLPIEVKFSVPYFIDPDGS
jgi:hypothetical protein